MTRDDMFHKLTLRYEELVCKYADKNVTDEQFFNELCCSVYAGEKFNSITLDDDCQFIYKGYTFELTPCTMLTTKQQVLDAADCFERKVPKGIFTDKYVCWLFGHKDLDGKTKKQSDDPDNWCSRVYLVPDAWAYGAEYDCVPDAKVENFILAKIDEFLKQNPDL